MKKIDENLERKGLEKVAESIRENFGEDISLSLSVRKAKIPATPDFVMVYQEVGRKILEGNMALSTSKVFFYLVVNIDFQNFIGIDLKSISENISMPLPTVKKAMKELKDAGILLSVKDNFDARRNIYRLNPLTAWKGKVRNRIKHMKENPAQITLFKDDQAV